MEDWRPATVATILLFLAVTWNVLDAPLVDSKSLSTLLVTARTDSHIRLPAEKHSIEITAVNRQLSRRDLKGFYMHFLWWIIVGLIAGWVTGKIMPGPGHGFLMDIVIGIAGALVGGWIMSGLGFAARGGMIYTILVAIGGAVLLTFLYRLVIGGRGRGGGETGYRKAA